MLKELNIRKSNILALMSSIPHEAFHILAEPQVDVVKRSLCLSNKTVEPESGPVM